MRVVVDVHGDDDAVARLHSWLWDRPGLAAVEISRGRGEVGPGDLGAAEVLMFMASDVMLPLILNALYDFFRDRRRSRPSERPRLVITRTDLPDGVRRVELEFEGPAETVVDLARRALEAPGQSA
ncbi:effector-associated constant component EACC1 [Micromonospora chersina]|uniref:effector-associated constant component EACC1 n=1 Tax=Micromonospora chersina TaxID=47854 RepID=UPI003710B399